MVQHSTSVLAVYQSRGNFRLQTFTLFFNVIGERLQNVKDACEFFEDKIQDALTDVNSLNTLHSRCAQQFVEIAETHFNFPTVHCSFLGGLSDGMFII